MWSLTNHGYFTFFTYSMCEHVFWRGRGWGKEQPAHQTKSEEQGQCKKDKIEENKIFKKNLRELMFNHITRCPSPLWGDSQGSFTASSADLKSTSSLASMYSLSLCSTRQAISTLAALSFHLTKTAHTTMLCHFCLNAAYGHKKPDHVLRAFPHRALHKYKKGVAINFSTFNHAVITVHLNKSSQREARISLCNILTYPW